MGLRRFRRKMRCLLRHGPRGCPHIERHSRRPRVKRSGEEPTEGMPRMSSFLPEDALASRGRHIRRVFTPNR